MRLVAFISFASEGGAGSFWENLDRPIADLLVCQDALIDYIQRRGPKL
jgi:hypothetical protein